MSSIVAHFVDNINHMDPPKDVLEAVHAVMSQARARHHRALRDAGLELTPLEARVLGFFARRPGATLTDLAAHAGRDKGQLARLVQALRDRGLLLGEPDEHDRRMTRLGLSPAAASLHEVVVRQRRRLAATAVSGLDDRERATLLELLARVRANLEA